MSEADAAAQLQDEGAVLLRGVFAHDSLNKLKDAAERSFEAVETEGSLAERHRFNRFSHSVPLSALAEFGCDVKELTAPLAAPELSELFAEAIGSTWACRMEHSWVRKKFAPAQAPDYHAQGWHQDGALGVQFPQQAGPMPPMTELLTCWIPLQACGIDSPGLELVRGCQQGLLHFTELNDTTLRKRFQAQEFWTPELEFGDGLVFLNNVLHRTYTRSEMQRNRLSVEYRIFPG
jgi:ectoine hydroxylase-related dioxygenase (phytanoyl-CoA dioxygenase family)